MTVLSPQIMPVIPRRYRLRWGFQFATRPTRRGPWDCGSDRPEDSAWAVNKEGLLKAFVEAEDIATHEVTMLTEVPGEDYATAQWEMHSRVAAIWREDSPVTAVRPRPIIHGLSLLTRDEKITVMVSGAVERRPLTAGERGFDIHEHRLGT